MSYYDEMKCPRCNVAFFPLVDHKINYSPWDNTIHYPFTGRCPKCEEWFEWEKIYTLNEITNPTCYTDEDENVEKEK